MDNEDIYETLGVDNNDSFLDELRSSVPPSWPSDLTGGAKVSAKSVSLAKAMLGEFIGTFLLVQIGTGAVMSGVLTDSLSLAGIAGVWTVAVGIGIAVAGRWSSAHLNPALTLAFSLVRGFDRRKVLPYWMAQVTGSTVAAAVNFGLYRHLIVDFEARHSIVRSSMSAMGSAKVFGEYFPSPVTVGQAFCAEALGTAILAAVVFSLTHKENEASQNKVYLPPLIGATVGALIGALAPLTQAGFNPARDFGPRMVAHVAGWTSVAFYQSWLYIVAPMLGAPLGAWLIDKVLYATPQTAST